MLYSTKENHGNYTLMSYVKRGIELCSPSEFIKYIRDYLPNAGLLTKISIALDYYFSLIRYGATICDYFEYQFWKKRSCERKEYVTKRKAQKIQNFFNTGDKEIVIDKKQFNKKFAKFRSVKNFYFDEGDVADFWSFVRACNFNVIAKTFMGASGMGIYKPDVTSYEKACNVYNDLKSSDNYFVEEVFIQTGIIGDVNPSSVNTIRIYTLFDGRDIHVMDAFVRFGGSKECVDNIHAGGMVCEVDINSGCIVAPGYNLLGQRYIFHPITHMLLPGILLPQWDETISIVKNAAKELPELGYIGWDIAVSNEKVCIIEANEVGNIDLVQVGNQCGCLKRYMKVVEIAKQNRKQ